MKKRKIHKYKNWLGEVVNLNNPNICGKEVAKLTWCEIRLECMRELGYALVYMKYLYPTGWNTESGIRQIDRVEKLCVELRRKHGCDSIQFWRGFLYRIRDEIENLC